MLAYRFCLPMYALLAVVLVLSLAQGGLLTQPSAVPAISLVLVSALTLQIWIKLLNPMATDGAASTGKIVGVYINGHWPDGSSIALNSAGATPFYADNMQYIDMLGLNDAQIARRRGIPKDGPWAHLVGHMKGDGASVLARKPDFIIIGPAEGTNTELPKKAYFIGDYEIGKSSSFKQNYQRCIVPASDSVVLTYYERRDLNYPCPADISNP